MGEKCLPDELRTLFLFEALNDEQLETLCEQRPDHRRSSRVRSARRRRPATCFYVLLDGELVMSKRSGGRRHRNQPHLPARRVLRRLVGVHPRRGAGLQGVGAGDQAVAVLRAGRRGVRALHEDAVSDGGPSARGPHGRRPAAAPDHRPAREAAGAGHHNGRPDPPAEQPGRGDRPGGRRSA